MKKSVVKRSTKGIGVRIRTVEAPARTYRSAASAAIHEAAEGLHKAGMIDNTTMKEFDQECLTPIIELSPAMIRRIRTEAAISQSVFAAHLNVTTGVVSKWERGEKQPSGPAAKLLSIAAKRGIAAIA
ncbi:MAG: helix-turn-helix domain-containing protein [Terracidiphilus sp.]|jgi:putative transcriptional regulator